MSGKKILEIGVPPDMFYLDLRFQKGCPCVVPSINVGSCHSEAEDQTVCPSAKTLSKIQRLEVWAEGALGKVHLEAGRRDGGECGEGSPPVVLAAWHSCMTWPWRVLHRCKTPHP